MPSTPTGLTFERISGQHISRPKFDSKKTSDRLREGTVFDPPPFTMGGNIRKGRRSVFKETGLGDECSSEAKTSHSGSENEHELYTVDDEKSFGVITGLRSERRTVSASKPESSQRQEPERKCESSGSTKLRRRQKSDPDQPWYARLYKSDGRPRVPAASDAPPGGGSGLSRFTMIVLLIAIIIPALSLRSTADGRKAASVANANPILRREDSPTDVCIRWAHQAAHVDGTIYIYGGQAKKDSSSESDNWNNYLLELDLSKDWSTSSPALKGMTVPDGPPEVSLGYLWNDDKNLYLYGGQFSDTPYVEPAPESIWKYSISDKEWTEWQDPKTSKGNYSTDGDLPVHRAAEGAGVSVTELGRSWYFGGHLDWATIPGWSRQIDRVYLKSLLEFTHPNFVNDGVENLADQGAGDRGAFRNITKGGVQTQDFPERADGSLVYVPGWGEDGVLIGLAGGMVDEFTDNLQVLDVYDIANSEWFNQNTTGDIPGVRVNPCAVVAGSKDWSSFQVYMFGGQNLQPYTEQIQYDDMYILSIPAFTWIKVEQNNDNRASARAGHTCTMRDGQMIVVGGYVGNENECDSPGIYVFDATTLKWKDKFESGDHDDDYESDNTLRSGSWGYKVPQAVQEAIGGGEDGGADASTPSASATGGPFATGKAPVVTITQAGSTATITSPSGSTGEPSDDKDSNSDSDSDSGSSSSSDDRSPGLIAAGVIAGIAGALAFYLGFCAWLYRRQVRAYKQHLAVANRYGTSPGPGSAALGLFGSRRGRGRKRDPSEHSSFGWVGSGSEPRWLSEPKFVSSEDASPGTASGSGGYAGAGGVAGKQSEETRPRTSSSGSGDSLLEGQEPSFFSVVMGPRRALRVVNGAE